MGIMVNYFGCLYVYVFMVIILYIYAYIVFGDYLFVYIVMCNYWWLFLIKCAKLYPYIFTLCLKHAKRLIIQGI